MFVWVEHVGATNLFCGFEDACGPTMLVVVTVWVDLQFSNLLGVPCFKAHHLLDTVDTVSVRVANRVNAVGCAAS